LKVEAQFIDGFASRQRIATQGFLQCVDFRLLARTLADAEGRAAAWWCWQAFNHCLGFGHVDMRVHVDGERFLAHALLACRHTRFFAYHHEGLLFFVAC